MKLQVREQSDVIRIVAQRNVQDGFDAFGAGDGFGVERDGGKIMVQKEKLTLLTI